MGSQADLSFSPTIGQEGTEEEKKFKNSSRRAVDIKLGIPNIFVPVDRLHQLRSCSVL